MPLIGFVIIIAVGTFCIFVGSYLIKSILDMGAASPEQVRELKHLAKFSETVGQMVRDFERKGYISKGEYNDVVYFYDEYVSGD